ncbi:MAG: hypothetical protein D6730_18990 [Bacteroidetes bacterium]|nr:MAG: hypothetical protein D6730_18990 [Bacteroidota bacterium]
MKDLFTKRLALLAVTLIVGYLLIRLILSNSQTPIVFELFAAIIGFALTVLTTSILLSKQTEAELSKEESIQFLNLKMSMYQELLNQLEDIIMKRSIKWEDIVELRLLNQRIAFIGSPEVLLSFNKFVRVFADFSRSEVMTEEMIDKLLDEMSKLTVDIRNDLFQNDTKVLSKEQIQSLILSSNEILDIDKPA